MSDALKNLSYSTVATAPSPATSGVSLVLAAGGGALMPAVPFNATIWQLGAMPTPTNAEIVTVTAVATDTLAIVRAQEGTTARTVVVGDQFAATVTARMLQEFAGAQNTQGTDVIQAASGRYIVDVFEVDNGESLEILDTGALEVG